ncbi:molybdate ABC transporter substrate-binding protein [Glycomyces buryatensis]|uniref:Molybdate-binding protein ModA n=1 Tax=Glycomyces buryatensis TaxID=2570927 RepID=A0A4S8QC79_9ACTN|nr:molybdate ABC transporter substrate-binding protein [Glycomyces buryatensis]THV41890.1 molybdate ABC transporter substrate-binding protein [Glycomyces buryatensis]
MRTATARTSLAALGCAALALSACTAGADADDGASQTTLSVFAAASLTESFEEIGADFETEHEGVTVEFNFAGSSTLASQINQGAPADVFASADEANMDTVVESGSAENAETFALNQLVIAVPEGNPGGVTGLGDLQGLKVAACAPEVPCGTTAQAVIDAAGGQVTPATYEADVRATLAKLTLGEVDAALVYRTDTLAAADEVDGIEFDEASKAVNAYPIAALTNAPNADLAREFTEYVHSDAAQSVLSGAGFEQP